MTCGHQQPKHTSKPHEATVTMTQYSLDRFTGKTAGNLHIRSKNFFCRCSMIFPYTNPLQYMDISGISKTHEILLRFFGSHPPSRFGEPPILRLPLRETLMPSLLRHQGYRCHAIGKWHLGHFRTASRRMFLIRYGIIGLARSPFDNLFISIQWFHNNLEYPK